MEKTKEDKILTELKSISTMIEELYKDREEFNKIKTTVERHDLLLDQYLNGVNIRSIQDDADMLLKTANELKDLIKQYKRPDVIDKIQFLLIIIIGAFSYYTRH